MSSGFLRWWKGKTDKTEPNRRQVGEDVATFEALEPRLLLDGAFGEAASQTLALFETSPALFVENQGQWADASVRYAFLRDEANVLFTDAGPVFQVVEEDAYAQFSVTFDGSNASTPVGQDLADGTFNYYLGDPSNWRSGVPAYLTVSYAELYDGIDLVTWGRRSGLKYEFHVAPGADYQQIRVDYAGIESLVIDDVGRLHVRTAAGELVEEAPTIYQETDVGRVEVAGAFRLIDSDTYTFSVTGGFDPTRELIIDPLVDWSTYVGGTEAEDAQGVAVDGAGNVLVTGKTQSSGWVSGGYDTTLGDGSDAYVVKLSPTGAHVWSTYLGGDSGEEGIGIAVDGSGNVLVTGRTVSSGWVSGGYDTTYNGDPDDAFVVKLSPTGSHLWSTYVGGDNRDYGRDIAADASGNVLVTGRTESSAWVSGGDDTTPDGTDAFVVKLSPIGAHLWSTYLGGVSGEDGYGIAADAGGNILAAGVTWSPGWVSGGYDTDFGGLDDGFVVKLDPSGVPLWSTYLGDGHYDYAYDVTVDGAGNVLATGGSYSSGWVSGGYDTDKDGGADAFVVKLSPTGAHLWSTYMGGTEWDEGRGIAVDAAGNVVVTGYTESSGWVSGGHDTELDANQGAFVVKVSASGAHVWSTYVGGSSGEEGHGIAVDAAGSVVVTGETYSYGWVSGGWDTTFDGWKNGFVVKISSAKPTDVIGRNAYGHWWALTSSDGDSFTNQLLLNSWLWSSAVPWVDILTMDSGCGFYGRNAYGHWWAAQPCPSGLASEYLGNWGAGPYYNVMAGDFDGDGATDDVVGRTAGGTWYVGINDGGTLPRQLMLSSPLWSAAVPWLNVMVADVNADGMDDIVARNAYGHWWACLSDGASYSNQLMMSSPLWSSAVPWLNVMVADVNADGMDDVVARNAYGHWWACVSDGTTFSNQLMMNSPLWSAAVPWVNVMVADVNVDGMDDVVARNAYGHWWACVSDGTTFGNRLMMNSPLWSSAVPWLNVMAADVNADGMEDVIARNAYGHWWACVSDGTSFSNDLVMNSPLWSSAVPWVNFRTADFDWLPLAPPASVGDLQGLFSPGGSSASTPASLPRARTSTPEVTTAAVAGPGGFGLTTADIPATSGATHTLSPSEGSARRAPAVMPGALNDPFDDPLEGVIDSAGLSRG